MSTFALKAGLSALHYSGLGRLLAPVTRGIGTVFMLHHVTPDQPAGFAPNRLLQITPGFLDEVVREVRRQGYDTVTLDEAHARISGTSPAKRPFACFTFDDGYRDNRDHALPVLKRHGVPFTIYVASDFADGQGFLWWLVLERVIAKRQFMAVELDSKIATFRCITDAEKSRTFERIYWHLRAMPETDARALVGRLAEDAGIDPLAPCRELCMTWDEIRALSADPLVSFGAHTMSHMALAKLPAHEAHAEIAGSVRRLERELDRPCRHFCYPYGDAGSASEREFELTARLGMATGVTTRKGLITAQSSGRATALPRLSLNGNYQNVRYLKALLCGAPFALLEAVRRPAPTPAYSPVGESGFCIQRTSQAAGTTQAKPPTT